MKILIVVDMQNDFIDGALGSKDAESIVDNVARKIQTYRDNDDLVIYTRDTHGEYYLETQEGRKLPIPHCIKGTHGWEISDKVYNPYGYVLDKVTFGAKDLPWFIDEIIKSETPFMDELTQSHVDSNMESIELVGLCTDICVISNAMVLKSHFPEVPIIVDSSCCAGVSRESHETALSAMRACQIDIV